MPRPLRHRKLNRFISAPLHRIHHLSRKAYALQMFLAQFCLEAHLYAGLVRYTETVEMVRSFMELVTPDMGKVEASTTEGSSEGCSSGAAPDENVEPDACRYCDVAEACLRGDSGARGRLRAWTDGFAASGSADLDPVSDTYSLVTLWFLPSRVWEER